MTQPAPPADVRRTGRPSAEAPTRDPFWLRLWYVVSQTGIRWVKNDGNLLATAMAYYAAFSFFPLLLVLIAGLGYALEWTGRPEDSQQQLLNFISKNVNPQLAEEVRQMMPFEAKEVVGDFHANVTHCPRCGEDHPDLLFHPLSHPAAEQPASAPQPAAVNQSTSANPPASADSPPLAPANGNDCYTYCPTTDEPVLFEQSSLEVIPVKPEPAAEPDTPPEQDPSPLDRVLTQVRSNASYSGPIGLGILLLGAIGIFSQLESAFDRIWHQPTPHAPGVRAAVSNALWNRLKAFLSLLALGALLIVAFGANVFLSVIQAWAEDLPKWAAQPLWSSVQTSTSIGFNSLMFMLVYRLMPRVKVRWLHAATGGLLVAVLWQVGSHLVARFLVGTYHSAYGVIGSFIAMMLWVYCGSSLLFIGAQLVEVLGYPIELENRLEAQAATKT